MFILTTKGYKNLQDYQNYRFSCIGYKNSGNPHILVKFKEEECYQITFLNGENIILGDKLDILCKGKDGKDYFMSLDSLKFGITVALLKTPQSVINQNKHMLKPLITDLLYKIENEGIIREINYDATYVDMITEWNDCKLKEYIFSLYSIGIYIHVKKSTNKENISTITLNSENLNYIFFDEYIEDITNDVIINMENNQKITKLKNKINIDKEREFVKIVKDIKKIKSLTLCKKTDIDNWNCLTVEGVIIKNKDTIIE